MNKRILVVCYSQSGQLRRCADAFVEPMKNDGAQVDFLVPKPETDFHWPWGFDRFLNAFPECVQSKAPPMKAETLTPPAQKYDLVIVAYQVWYLAPALPIVGWLTSDAAKVLRDTPVIALCACRNMWQRAFIKIRELVAQNGGVLIDHVVREDSGPAWATFWTTPRWVVKGDKKGATGLFPEAGVSEEDIASLRRPGSQVSTALSSGPLTHSILNGSQSPIHKAFLIPELGAQFFFHLWARAISKTSGGLRWFLLRVFFVCLCSSVPLILPVALVALTMRIFARSWFQTKIDELTA